MPAKNPRVNVVVESRLYGVLCDLAEREGVSLSTIARDLIREAVELREDISLAGFADSRMRTLKKGKTLSHKETWE